MYSVVRKMHCVVRKMDCVVRKMVCFGENGVLCCQESGVLWFC